MHAALWIVVAVLLLAAVRVAIDRLPSRPVDPEPPAKPVLATCMQCPRPVPPGTTWCSFVCRSYDDRHDDSHPGGDRDA
ncbi:hypothetical protein ACWEFL_02580 [Streptomyces sp. NPDC004838]